MRLKSAAALFSTFMLLFNSVGFAVQNKEIKFNPSLEFGLASAAAHAEDQLQDIWKNWADTGHIKAFHNTPQPNERLKFWTQPEVELDLAAQTGIQIYRMGLDWGRIQPSPGQFDQVAIERYRSILQSVKKRNMKVMLTLMHHSIPVWAQDRGGWKNSELKDQFITFAQRMIREYRDSVDYWITFNEANVYISLSYVVGIWPPGEKLGASSFFSLGPIKGSAVKALDLMATTHKEIYTWAHKNYPSIKMGIAHNMAYYTSKSLLSKANASILGGVMNWRFPNKIKRHMDFFGFNYYGAEWLKGTSIDVNDPKEEYSEAGRAIYPEGLRYIIKKVKKNFSGLPIIITENGIADSTDVLRPAYMIEHLKVIQEEMQNGAPIVGYIFWTLSDNMEWADGYCPKFGLAAVDRGNGLKRKLRPSYYLFTSIVKNKKITSEQISNAYDLVERNYGKLRPFCRDNDGETPLNTPIYRPLRWKIKK